MFAELIDLYSQTALGWMGPSKVSHPTCLK